MKQSILASKQSVSTEPSRSGHINFRISFYESTLKLSEKSDNQWIHPRADDIRSTQYERIFSVFTDRNALFCIFCSFVRRNSFAS